MTGEAQRGRTGQRLRTALPAVAAGVAIGGAVFAAFLALAHLSLGTGADSLRQRIARAFAEGSLQPQASWQHGDTRIGAHQFNDCLILYQALDDRAPAARRAISPLTAPIDTDFACERLERLTGGAEAPPTRFYHQYLHAHTSLARLLVPGLGVSGLRGLYKLLLSLTLLAGMAYAVIGLARRERTTANLVWLVWFVVFARWFGLESFGQSLGHGPADLVVVGWLLWLSRASASGPIAPRTAVAGAAAFGALTIQLEFLTGGLPLGIALVLGALPLALAPDARIAATVARALLAFLAAAATGVAAKLALVAAAFGTAPIGELAAQILFRTGLSQHAARDAPISFGGFFGNLFAGMEGLAAGMHWLALGTLLLALGGGIHGYRVLRRAADPADRARAACLAASVIVPPLWMVLLWQHTAQHAWFMDRILAWCIAGGAALFILALNRRGTDQPSASTPGCAR